MAERVRVRGDLFHGHLPAGAVYVGRQAPGLPRSPFANPYSVKEHGRDGALRRYRAYLRERPDLVAAIRTQIGPSRDVACWCRADERCHGDVVLAVAAGEDPYERTSYRTEIARSRDARSYQPRPPRTAR